jgi:hypothetical protein
MKGSEVQMNKDNELYRQLIKEKSEANLKFVGKSIEQLYADEFDRIIEESKDTEVPEQLHNKLTVMLKEEQNKRKKKERNKRLVKYGKICACLLAAVLLSGAILMTNVEAFRAKVFEIFFNEQPNYIDFKQIEIPYDNNGIIPSDWNGFWYPKELPDGYTLADYTRNGQAIDLIFKNVNNDMIFFSQSPTDDLNLLVDNTNQNPEEIEIDSGTAYWTSIEDSNLLMWDKGGAFFLLQSELSKEDMIQIAENITYLKK